MAVTTLPSMILDREERRRDRTLFGTVSDDGSVACRTWGEVLEDVLSLAAALTEAGFEAGDRGAIFAYNSAEWYVVDWAIQFLGGVSVPIYMNNTSEQAAYVLADSGARVVFCDTPERKAAVVGQLDRLPDLVRVLTLAKAPDDPERVEALADAVARGLALGGDRHDAIRKAAAAIDPASTATLSYTSGTTGEPKGVVISHDNFIKTIEGTIAEVGIGGGDDERTISYLPLAHIAQRILDQVAFHFGAALYFPPDITKVVDTFAIARPTFLVCVPRVLEKVVTKIENRVAEAPVVRQKIFAWAKAIAFETADRLQEARPLGLGLLLRRALADRLVFRKIRSAFGGEVEYILAGGAPLARDLGRFFLGLGIPIYEVYGLTETTAIVSFDRPDAIRYGTVGKPSSLGDVRLAEDGEILYRGANLFSGYWNKEAATAEAIVDGWFHTGDLGEFDADGYLRIIGRKKELIVTSAGKNIAPIPIEFAIGRHPLIDQLMVVGDQRNYLTALLTLNLEEAQRRFGAGRTAEELAAVADIRSEIEAHIEQVNAGLARYETVKRFEILPGAWSPDTGELTPSMKLKRSVIASMYAEAIDRMYAETASPTH